MSKGGSSTSQVEIPAWLENAAIENINRARQAQEIGYTPYYGPDVAAFSPMQTQAMQATGSAAQAFGLAGADFDPLAGVPQAQEFAGGLMGYSSAPLYEQSVAELQAQRPAQAAAIEGMFIDPVTGRMGQTFAPTVEQISQSGYAQDGDTAAVQDALLRSPEYVDSLFEPANDGGTGYYGGPELPKDVVRGLTDDQFEAYTLAEGLQPADPTTGLANFVDDMVRDYNSSGGLIGMGASALQSLIGPASPDTIPIVDQSTYLNNPSDSIAGFSLSGGLPPSDTVVTSPLYIPTITAYDNDPDPAPASGGGWSQPVAGSGGSYGGGGDSWDPSGRF